jgi:hypothetical protein
MAKPLQHQIITRALDIVSDEARWTCGAIARTADGTACLPLDTGAVRFCAAGALHRASGGLLSSNGYELAIEAEHLVRAASNEVHGLPSINDAEGREAIVAMFKRALAESA